MVETFTGLVVTSNRPLLFIPPPETILTERQSEVLALMAKGQSNKDIADELVIGIRTVERHITEIFLRLDIAHRGDLSRRVAAVLRYLEATA